MKKAICIAVVLMFVVSACGSSDELSQPPVVGSKVTAVDHSPTTTVTDSTDLNDEQMNMPVYDRYGILGLKRSEAAAILANIEEVSSSRLVHENCSDEAIPTTLDISPGRVNLTTTDDVVVHYWIEHIDKPDDDLPTAYNLNPQPACEVELRTAASSTITYLEGGGYDFLPFSLSEAPLVPVIVRFEALDPTEVALSDESVAEIEVTADNYENFGPSWRAPQDGIDDGDQTTQVRVSVIAVPSDPIFGNTKDLIITVITKDRAPSIDDH